LEIVVAQAMPIHAGVSTHHLSGPESILLGISGRNGHQLFLDRL
jgi:hypothetical protein